MTTAVLRGVDDDDRPVVGVPLSNHPAQRAWLYETDYEAIQIEHGAHAWFLHDNGSGTLYVRLRSSARRSLVMAARLVVSDPHARRIRYRDGDTLNLRSRNLLVCRGRRGPVNDHPRKARR
jgi:hypothetical protein